MFGIDELRVRIRRQIATSIIAPSEELRSSRLLTVPVGGVLRVQAVVVIGVFRGAASELGPEPAARDGWGLECVWGSER